MKINIKKILCSFAVLFAIWVSTVHAAEDSKNDLTLTVDNSSPTGFYIPATLEDCYKELQKMISPEALKELKEENEKDIAIHHLSLRMLLPHIWGLDSESRLAKYFNSIGISHPDDMSSIIMISFWRHLNEKPINLEQQL